MQVEERNRLKQRRRTLKNRGYAQTCRTRKVNDHHKLQHTTDALIAEVNQLKKQVSTLTTERDHCRAEVSRMKQKLADLSAEIDCHQLKEKLAVLTAERDYYQVEAGEFKEKVDILTSERDHYRNQCEQLVTVVNAQHLT